MCVHACAIQDQGVSEMSTIHGDTEAEKLNGGHQTSAGDDAGIDTDVQQDTHSHIQTNINGQQSVTDIQDT